MSNCICQSINKFLDVQEHDLTWVSKLSSEIGLDIISAFTDNLQETWSHSKINFWLKISWDKFWICNVMFASPILKEKLRFFQNAGGGGNKKIKLKLRYNFLYAPGTFWQLHEEWPDASCWWNSRERPTDRTRLGSQETTGNSASFQSHYPKLILKYYRLITHTQETQTESGKRLRLTHANYICIVSANISLSTKVWSF